jgi:heptosyltransferase-2
LCGRIERAVELERCFSLAGQLRWLETAALVARADAVISNDSAPVHMASAMGTPVVEIYGATSPEFGFTPWQVQYEIVQVDGLDCKPCAIHGGMKCPIGTFECMNDLSPDRVVQALIRLING